MARAYAGSRAWFLAPMRSRCVHESSAVASCAGHRADKGPRLLGLSQAARPGSASAVGHVGTPAGYDLDQALIRENPDSLAGGEPRHPVLLHEACLRGDRPSRRIVAALDRIAQDRRYLQVERHLALMIDGHAIKVADQRGRQIDLSDPSPVYRGIMMRIEQAAPDGELTPLPGA
jgi:hypothetical protein